MRNKMTKLNMEDQQITNRQIDKILKSLELTNEQKLSLAKRLLDDLAITLNNKEINEVWEKLVEIELK